VLSALSHTSVSERRAGAVKTPTGRRSSPRRAGNETQGKLRSTHRSARETEREVAVRLKSAVKKERGTPKPAPHLASVDILASRTEEKMDIFEGLDVSLLKTNV